MKTFSDGEFVKECSEAVVKDILPDKSKLFSKLSLSRQPVCRRINDISNEIMWSSIIDGSFYPRCYKNSELHSITSTSASTI